MFPFQRKAKKTASVCHVSRQMYKSCILTIFASYNTMAYFSVVDSYKNANDEVTYERAINLVLSRV